MNDITPQEQDRREVALVQARRDHLLGRAIVVLIVAAVLAVMLWGIFRDSGADTSEYVAPSEPACQVSFCP